MLTTACSHSDTGGDQAAADSVKLDADSLISAAVGEAADDFDSYSGVLPCADCDGVETTVNLYPDATYEVHILYYGRASKGPGSNEFSEKGSWTRSGDTIVLKGLKNAPGKYLLSDSSLIQLDQAGRKVEGPLAGKYVLKQIFSTPVQQP
ncbi:copper resistance protein NlpE N-terminal domain-containing protein [Compostibacter hankyongensis]|uniref:Copper resistance protein NlpE N-terminal domain-containing protein n=2 Tax=Compostibacter hankyongensis TaxID=1007089 RepID=A0ABP8FGN7_9BACT